MFQLAPVAGSQLGYHDPVYDDTGTPGGAVVPLPAQDNTVLWLAALAVLLLLN